MLCFAQSVREQGQKAEGVPTNDRGDGDQDSVASASSNSLEKSFIKFQVYMCIGCACWCAFNRIINIIQQQLHLGQIEWVCKTKRCITNSDIVCHHNNCIVDASNGNHLTVFYATKICTRNNKAMLFGDYSFPTCCPSHKNKNTSHNYG